MTSDEQFKSCEQDFYIDNSSWSTPIEEKKMVVFKPVKEGVKKRAKDIRPIDIELDRRFIKRRFIY